MEMFVGLLIYGAFFAALGYSVGRYGIAKVEKTVLADIETVREKL